MQVTPPVTHTFRIRRPDHVSNAERYEERLTGEIESAHAGCLGDDAGEQVHPATTINELVSRLCHHRQIEHELRPVPALSHLAEGRFIRLKLAIKSRTHSDEVLGGEPLLSRITIGDLTVGEDR